MSDTETGYAVASLAAERTQAAPPMRQCVDCGRWRYTRRRPPRCLDCLFKRAQADAETHGATVQRRRPPERPCTAIPTPPGS